MNDEIIGKRYEHLLVVGTKPGGKSVGLLAVCVCDCGKTVEMQARHISRYKSCGCSKRNKPHTSAIERLMKRVDKSTSENGCWLWEGSLGGGGRYGLIKNDDNSGSVLVHRVSYEFFKGEIPEEMYVCHTCDNPRCVNPDHLFLGTQSDNMRDCVAKGRHSNGRSRSGATK